MANQVDLYDSAYGNYELDVYREIRIETYGEDLGQTSWVTKEESDAIPGWLELRPDCAALEIGCGSGRYALRVAEAVGCRVLGLDINAHGIANANELARRRDLQGWCGSSSAMCRRGFPSRTRAATRCSRTMCCVICLTGRGCWGRHSGCCGRADGCCSATRWWWVGWCRTRRSRRAARSDAMCSRRRERMNG